ncbi:MAG: helix-hairpin-helix domain-containing protein, partial [Balneolales bacterium]|nr:helix-hairpin-helix domain-containing protein [Balneolales bacterium]
YERTAERYEEKRELLERYYPGQPDTIESLARALIPPEFEPEIQQVIEMRQQVPPSTSIVQADTTKPERPPDSVRININTATLTELTKLPGIGPSIAARIIEYREQNGSFKRVDDITNVRGIGQTRLEQLREILEI